jgi:hypothetical protein
MSRHAEDQEVTTIDMVLSHWNFRVITCTYELCSLDQHRPRRHKIEERYLEAPSMTLPSIFHVSTSRKVCATDHPIRMAQSQREGPACLPLLGVPVHEILLADPLAALAAEPHADTLAWFTLDLSNKYQLASVRVKLKDLRKVRVPEAGDNLIIETVIPDREGGVAQAIGGELHAMVALSVLLGCHRSLVVV